MCTVRWCDAFVIIHFHWKLKNDKDSPVISSRIFHSTAIRLPIAHCTCNIQHAHINMNANEIMIFSCFLCFSCVICTNIYTYCDFISFVFGGHNVNNIFSVLYCSLNNKTHLFLFFFQTFFPHLSEFFILSLVFIIFAPCSTLYTSHNQFVNVFILVFSLFSLYLL